MVYRNFNISICLFFFFTLLLAEMYIFTPIIFTVPIWDFEVATSKTEYAAYSVSYTIRLAIKHGYFDENHRTHTFLYIVKKRKKKTPAIYYIHVTLYRSNC